MTEPMQTIESGVFSSTTLTNCHRENRVCGVISHA